MMDAAGSTNYSKVVTAIVKSLGVFDISAYPNPITNGNLTIEAHGIATDADIVISDVTGKPVRSLRMLNGKAEVNMEGLAPGVYLVKYSDGANRQTIRISKQ